jgi:hypothetical protein
MKSLRIYCLVLSQLLFSVLAFASDKTDNWVTAPNVLSLTAAQKLAWVNAANAQIFLSHVNDVIGVTIGACKGYAPDGAGNFVVNIHSCGAEIDKSGKATGKAEVPNFPGVNDYVIIHVVRWQDLAAGTTVQTVDKQNWYVASGAPSWSDADFGTNNRVFGKKQVYLLYINFNMNSLAPYSLRYDIKTSSKLPAYLNNLIQLGQIAGLGTAGGAAGVPSDGWNADLLNIAYVPSDIQITATIQPTTGAPTQVDQKTFDNEGKYHIDFSVGVPIKKISDVSYTSSSNTLVPTSVNKANLYALVDYYPWAVDVKAAWTKYPHIVAGVAMSSQPLHNTLYAIAYGPVVANFYGGASLNVKQLPPGSSCSVVPTSAQTSAGLTKHICPEFAFGLKVSVGAIAQSLKSAKK